MMNIIAKSNLLKNDAPSYFCSIPVQDYQLTVPRICYKMFPTVSLKGVRLISLKRMRDFLSALSGCLIFYIAAVLFLYNRLFLDFARLEMCLSLLAHASIACYWNEL